MIGCLGRKLMQMVKPLVYDVPVDLIYLTELFDIIAGFYLAFLEPRIWESLRCALASFAWLSR